MVVDDAAFTATNNTFDRPVIGTGGGGGYGGAYGLGGSGGIPGGSDGTDGTPAPSYGSSGSDGVGYGVWIENASVTLQNNILVGSNDAASTGLYEGLSSTLTSDYNAFYAWGANYGTGVPAGAHDLASDPLFVDASSYDYYLQQSSPCIETGNNGAAGRPPDDFDDFPRPFDSDQNGTATVEIGAYEDHFVNHFPSFTSDEIESVSAGAAYTYNITADDPDLPEGDVLTITATSRPLWLTLTDNGNGTATLSGTPTMSHLGPHDVTLQVTDLAGTDDIQSFTITVSNDPPSFTSTAVTGVSAGATYTYDITTTDPNLPGGDSLTIIANTKPAWLTLTDYGDGTATLSGAPTMAEIGDHTVTLRVHDDQSAFDTQSFTVTVSHDPPTITSAEVTSVNVGETYTYDITAADPNLPGGDTLTITASPKPAWLTLVDNGDGTAALSGIPGSGTGGDHPVTIQVQDANGLTDTQSFTITVIETYKIYLPMILR